jgi:hypothetical protein
MKTESLDFHFEGKRLSGAAFQEYRTIVGDCLRSIAVCFGTGMAR